MKKLSQLTLLCLVLATASALAAPTDLSAAPALSAPAGLAADDGGDGGASIDPNGVAVAADGGASIDPNGLSLAAGRGLSPLAD